MADQPPSATAGIGVTAATSTVEKELGEKRLESGEKNTVNAADEAVKTEAEEKEKKEGEEGYGDKKKDKAEIKAYLVRMTEAIGEREG